MLEHDVLREPTRGELIEIAGELGIRVDKQADFVKYVQELSVRLLALREQGISPEEAHQRAKKSLTKALKSLQEARSAVSKEEVLLGLLVNGELAANFGSVLSLRGIRKLLGGEHFFSLDERDLELAIKRSRDGGTDWITRELQQRTQMVVADYPVETLINLIGLLVEIVNRQLDIQGKSAGGRPRNTEREYALNALEKLHKIAFEKQATTAPGGTFNCMCEAVFYSLNLDDTGLSTAIGRWLRR